MMTFEAVIFDWDGTLADTRSCLIKAFQDTFTRIGCKVSDEFIERRIGIGEKGVFEEALKSSKIAFTDNTIEELSRQKQKIQLKLVDSINLFDGSIDLLRILHQRVKVGLATMAHTVLIEKILRKKEIRKYFDCVVTVDEVIKPKPNPEIFLKCAMKLKVNPEKCVVIEDSIFGVKAAKSTNMKCIAITSGAYSAEELKEGNPDLIVNSIKEKEQITDFISGSD